MAKRHKCTDHWLWRQICGMRVYEQVGRRQVYTVRCSECGRSAEVSSDGKEYKDKV